MDNRLILIHTDKYANWVFDTSHPTQGRRFTKARDIINMLAESWGVQVTEIESAYEISPAELARVHAPEYVTEVLVHHTSHEWTGARPDLAELAQLMCGGTFTAAKLLHAGAAKTAIHLPGAKHHAMRDHSSGFCVFNDFALAAHQLTDLGHRIAILDIDAHRGDGTEVLTSDNPDILTFSIHDESIFPWSPGSDIPAKHLFNRPLPAHSGGRQMLEQVRAFIRIANEFQPTMIFIAAGADGHATDPLSTLRYSEGDYRTAARRLRAAFPDLPMLMGGAGGYQPDRATPRVWSAFALTLAGGISPRMRDAMERRAARAPGRRSYISLEGHDLNDDAVVDRLALEIWENFMTTEGKPWEKN